MSSPMISEEKIDQYIQYLKDIRRRTPKTTLGYAQDLRRMARATIPLKSSAISDYINKLDDGRPAAISTRNRRLHAVKGFVRWLIQQGELRQEDDPTAALVAIRPPTRERTRLTPSHLAHALMPLRGTPPDWMTVRGNSLIRLLFFTGLRISECLSIDTQQVDRDRGLIHDVRRKGGDVRPVVLCERAIAAISAWVAVRPENPIPALFVSRLGSRLSVRSAQSILKTRGEAAGLPAPLTPHAIRHVSATTLLRLGADLDVVSDVLNHESIRTTQLYLHSSENDQREALSRLPALRPPTRNAWHRD